MPKANGTSVDARSRAAHDAPAAIAGTAQNPTAIAAFPGIFSDLPDVAFSRAAPLVVGPFVTSPTRGNTQDREPRSRETE